MSKSKKYEATSKLLSYFLRHRPDEIGLTLDENGWADINELIEKGEEYSKDIELSMSAIYDIVEHSDKKRFIISDDDQRIRANQGHSINIDLQLTQATPPEFLYHGTATRFLDSILEEGLKPQQRQHVHLSTDIETAMAVGQRYGKPVILTIKALLMHEQGFVFYLSENGVWLIEQVSRQYIQG